MKGLFRRHGGVADLKAGKLRLVAISAEMLNAEATRAHEELGRLLKAQVTEEWPPEHWEPHVFVYILAQYVDAPDTVGWHRYVVLEEDGWATLIGAVGGFPKAEGDVEIGYSTLPAFQRKGHGTAAAKKLVEWLLRRSGVKSVSAQTFLRLGESVKVMERCGMSLAGVGDDPETVRYRRMR